jgi:uncharacterized protein YbjT (DUF2867 family)
LAATDHKALEIEVAQGKAAIDAAKAAGVKHLVFSGLEDVEALTAGEEKAYRVPHFDGKGRIEKYATESGVPSSFARYSFYMDNWAGMMKPTKNEDGTYTIGLPMGDVPMGIISVEDAGPAVASIFGLGDEAVGNAYGLAGELLPISEVAAIFSRVLGKEVKYVDMPDAAFRALPIGPHVEDLANMFAFYHDERCVRDVEQTRTLNPKARGFEAWLTDNKALFADL